MDLGLAGKVVIVTGGSEGIGKATALALGREGARVVVCARRADVLAEAAAEVRMASGAEIVAVPADVTDPEAVARVVATAIDRFGRLDAVVNNAGTSRAAAFEAVSDEVWRDDLDLKLFAAIRLTRLAVPHLRAAGGGSVVNLLNIAAKQPPAASLPTSVSRAAGLALTKALSKDLARDAIRVNAVLIGLVKSGQHDRKWQQRGGDREAFYRDMARDRGVPLGRVGEADEPAALIAFLCSPRAAFISGVAINVDGGASAVV
jgi:NAD(P)-dependent dehydrogenase (short-subunit alcohol dehydrogenase family)